MILHAFRALEQRFRDEARADSGTVRDRYDQTRAETLFDCADELAAVCRELEARLEGLEKYTLTAYVNHLSMQSMAAVPYTLGEWIRVADLAACLVGAKEPR